MVMNMSGIGGVEMGFEKEREEEEEGDVEDKSNEFCGLRFGVGEEENCH